MRSVCLLLVLVVLFAACRGAEGPSDQPEPAAAPAPTAVVIRKGRLVEVDARTLEPLPNRAVSLGRHYGGLAVSPDGLQLAVGGWKSVRVVDLTSFEVVADLPKPHGFPRLVSWGDPERIVVVSQVFRKNRADVHVIDAASGPLVSRRGVSAEDGRPLDARSANGSAAFLVPSPSSEGIGPTRLVSVDRSGRSRVYRLGRIASGNQWTGQVMRFVWPALALDDDGTHAYVVGAADLVAEVDLERGRVEYHALEPSVSLAARLRNWLEPTAAAKGSNMTQLGALWLGEGRLALYGMRIVPREDSDTHQEISEALAFRIVNTADWSVQTVDDEVVWLDRAGDTLVGYGDLWNSATQRHIGIGLRAYDLDGEELFRVLGDRSVRSVVAVGSRVFARIGDEEAGAVAIDLATGRVERDLVAFSRLPSRVVLPDAP